MIETWLIPAGVGVIVLLFYLLAGVYLMVYAERKVIADMQNRIGPFRVGPFGLLQPMADFLKLFMKEDFIPRQADKVFYYVAPALAFLPPIAAASVIPFSTPIHIGRWTIPLQLTDPSLGVLIVLAFSSLAVYGIVIAGWSSSNKYSLLGAIRSSAQMISYELAMGLSLISIFLVVGSLKPSEIVAAQGPLPFAIYLWHDGKWFFPQTIAFLVFVIAMYAETNRAPFDLPEAESELVAGYHTEYSSMKFAMFFMAEYMGMVTMSALCVTVFLGGWHGPIPGFVSSIGGVDLTSIAGFGTAWVWGGFWFMLKLAIVMLCFIWVRATYPRFRYDQLMRFGWKFLLPIAIANILITGLTLAVGG
jgi:NADH-quinone oxidoreductase subunit H